MKVLSLQSRRPGRVSALTLEARAHSNSIVSSSLLSILSSFLVLLALSSPCQGFVYPSSPIGVTVWKPNTMVTISWTDDHSSPLLSTKPVFDIFLMTGADDHQIKLATIASNVKGGSVSSVKYLVPYVAPPGQIYFLMFQTKDTKATAWATRFTITDATGNPGSLHPVIPEGGKINPGGVGVIVGTPGTGGHRTPHSPHLPGNPSTNPINQNNSNFKTLGKPVQQPGATGPGSSDSNVNGDANPGMAENNTNQNKKDYQFGPDEAALARTVPSTAANEHHGRLVMMGSILLALTLYFFV